MPDPTSHTYFSQRLRLHYLHWGNEGAPPLLLLHGSRDHAHNRDWVAARFRDRYHVIAPDFRGHGDSQWTLGSMYAPAEMAYDVAQLVHQRRLAPVRIVATRWVASSPCGTPGPSRNRSSDWSWSTAPATSPSGRTAGRRHRKGCAPGSRPSDHWPPASPAGTTRWRARTSGCRRPTRTSASSRRAT